MSTPRVDQINVVVSNVEAAAKFLTGLGIELPDPASGWDALHRSVPAHKSLHGGHDLVEPAFGIDLDSNQFAHHWGSLGPSFEGVVLNVRVDERDEVDQLHELALTLGGRSLKAPYDTFWGSRYATVEGPGPLAIGLMSVPEPEQRTAPPDPATLQ